MILLTEDELQPSEVAAAALGALGGGAGGLVTFVGVVRDNADGHQIEFLEYSAYPEMAVAEMTRIAGEALERWGLHCAIAHRLGRLQIGEASIVVSVAAPHRKEAFEACHWALDEVKSRVPIWKKETSTSGHWWVEDPLQKPRLAEKTSSS